MHTDTILAAEKIDAAIDNIIELSGKVCDKDDWPTIERMIMRIEPTWVSGDVTLYLGNCLDILPMFEVGSVDAVVTDPPYGVEGGHGGQTRDYLKADYFGDGWEDTPEYVKSVCAPAIVECIRIAPAVALTPGTRCTFSYPQPDDMGCFWSPAAPRRGKFGFAVFHPILYYGKNYLSGKAQSPAGITMTESAEKCGFPCPKPLKAWTWLVNKMCPPNGICLDPFMGSGTTGVACVKTERKFIGIERDMAALEIAKKRIIEAQAQLRLF